MHSWCTVRLSGGHFRIDAALEFIGGRKRLAGLLSSPSSADDIKLNQAAISELKEKIEWRQSVQARGRLIPEDGSELNDLKKWLKTPVSIVFKPAMMAVLYGLPAVTIVTIILSGFL